MPRRRPSLLERALEEKGDFKKGASWSRILCGIWQEVLQVLIEDWIRNVEHAVVQHECR